MLVFYIFKTHTLTWPLFLYVPTCTSSKDPSLAEEYSSSGRKKSIRTLSFKSCISILIGMPMSKSIDQWAEVDVIIAPPPFFIAQKI